MKQISSHYKVSTSGDIYKYRSQKKVWQKCAVNYAGQGRYGIVSMNGRNAYIHVVVFKAYNDIDKIPVGMQIDHIDNNHHNNHYTNLRMITRSENARKAIKRSHEGNKLNHHLTYKKVRIKFLETGKVKTFKSITRASKELEIPQQSIVDNLKGRTKNCHKKYKCIYA